MASAKNQVCRRSRALGLAVVLACACPLSGRADPVSWSSAISGNWTDTTNWLPMVVPDATSDVTFDTGSPTAYTVTLTNASAANSITLQGDNVTLASGGNPLTVGGTLTLDGLGGQVGSLTVVGPGSVAAAGEIIGNSTVAIFTQTGGTNTVSGSLTMAAVPGAFGTYNLSGAGLLSVTGSEYVGNQGTGVFNQSSGTHTVTSALFIGNFTGSTGTYNLTGAGILQVSNSELVANNGTGYFNQSGGTNTLTNSSGLVVGENAGAVGYYTLSGSGVLSVQGTVVIGNSTQSTGSFVQSGGTANFGKMDIALRATSTGSYTLSGGTLSVPIFEAVGDGGVGVFTQTGGTNNTSLSVATNAGANGTYYLQDGTLNASSLAVNVNGTFSQTGGTLAFTSGAPLIESGGAIVLGGPQTLYSLNRMFITGGTTVLTSDASKVLATTAVTISGTGTLDLNNNALVVNSTANKSDVISMLLGLVNQARNGAANDWMGVGGITSSTVAAGDHVSTGGMGLAVADAAELPNITNLSSFRGQSIDSNSIIVVAAHTGDVTLDGRIDIADLNDVTSHWQMTGAIWSEGDTAGGPNGGPNGTVDIADLNAVTSFWQWGVGAGLVPQVGAQSDTPFNSSPVPEPASVGVLVLAGAGLLVRRRRG